MPERARAFQAVRDLARASQGALEPGKLLERLCSSVAETFGFERAVILRYDERTDGLRAVAAYGVELERLRGLPREPWALHRQAMESRRPVVVRDVRTGGQMPADIAEAFGVHAAAAVPLLSEGRCLGVISADRGGRPFDLEASELELLEIIGALAASFLEKALVHDELRRLDELKTAFVALASHELRTPASVVYGISATLYHRGESLAADQRAALGRALYEQSDRMRELVDQLLDLSRLEAGSIRIRPERRRLRPSIERLVLLSAQARAPEVEVSIPPELEADVDVDALDRVVSNLLANALRYGDPPFTIAAVRDDGLLLVSVEDRGRGVPPEFVPRLFERFTRSETSSVTGAGLGLSIARSFALAHGGELRYRPATPHGARFELLLPDS